MISHRGLTPHQKVWVAEAFEENKIGGKEIVNYFRAKRSLFAVEEIVADPERMKLNNYIQALKKKKTSINNPSANDSVKWCQSHGQDTVDIADDASFNTPFVLRFNAESFIYFT